MISTFEDIRTRVIDTYRRFNPQKIILFSSYAQESPDERSDIDLIIVYRTKKRFLDRLKELYEAWSIPKGVDILAYTPREFERMRRTSAFLSDAVETGRILYEHQ